MKNVDLKNETANGTKPVLPAVTFEGLFKSWLAKFACHHKWYVHHKCDVYNGKDKIPIRFEQTLICQDCGKIKKMML